MEFRDAVQQQEDDLDVSPDDEEEEEETRVEVEEEEDPYEYDEELPVAPEYGRDASSGPNTLNDDLILEGKQHQDKDGIVLGTEYSFFRETNAVGLWYHRIQCRPLYCTL
jgi:hypothetical protein